MNLLRIAWRDDDSLGGEVRLRDGRVIQCEFYWKRHQSRGGAKPAIFNMDGSGVQESRIMARANVYFADATYELTDDSQALWSDDIRLAELRADDDTRATGVLVTADGQRVEFGFDIPQQFEAPALSEFLAVAGDFVPDPAHRGAIDKAIQAFQVAAGPHPA